MKKRMMVLALISSSLMFCGALWASELGVTPVQAYEMNKDGQAPVLLVDVRDPVEIMFVGFTDEVDLNIPFLMVDRQEWDEKKNRFRLYRNPDFVEQIEQALKARGLDKTATIITMCRSGSERGLPSAQYLRDQGFKNARYVINGFQGGSLKAGEHKGMRIKNGWQNSGLPWGAKPNPDKIYRADKRQP
ncbi:rhodanese-like domain-containing protein [Oceanospirillum sp.]|uniref:rhodanese-like domain-containing protein n=1 Tax=Oceanospirillum sp. TaxID=2021254 RepID=UPI003A92142E